MSSAAKSRRPPRRNFNAIHSQPLPLRTTPLPAFHPTSPLSLLRLAWFLLSETLTYRASISSLPSHSKAYQGYYSPATRSVHITDEAPARALWEQGFFGKGSLSRSEPEWLQREKDRLAATHTDKHASAAGSTAGEVTRRRREERKEEKRQRAKREREELEERLREEGKFKELDLSPDGTGLPTLPVGDRLPGSNAEANTLEKSNSRKAANSKEQATELKVSNSRESMISSLPDNISAEKTMLHNEEHLQLQPQEAFFLAYGLGILQVRSPPPPKSNPCSLNKSSDVSSTTLSTSQLFSLFRRTSTFPAVATDALLPDDPFLVHYVVYHHFRSLGWVVRPGIKFAVDWLLYARGPVFAHAEFAVIVLPSYSRDCWRSTSTGNDEASYLGQPHEHQAWKEKGEWWWLHMVNRVQNQVKKSLVLVYVEVPHPDDIEITAGGLDQDIGKVLRQYRVREFVIRRWSPNRSRD